MISTQSISLIAALTASTFAFNVNAAITQLTSPAQINTAYLNDFETGINSGPAIFNHAQIFNSSQASTYVTSSGIYGLGNYRTDPIEALLSTPYTAVGLYFGNDDLGFDFYATLEVFSGAYSLGSVAVAANKNDYVDQFIGLSSTTAFDRVTISYTTGEQLYVFIDDFNLGSPSVVPVPAAAWLFGSGLLGLIGIGKRKNINA
jgi:hypothetical protein